MVYLRQWLAGYRYKTTGQPVGFLIFVIQGEMLISAPGQWLRLAPGYVGVLPKDSNFVLECTKDFFGLYFILDDAENKLNSFGLAAAEGDTPVKVMAELVRQELQKSVQSNEVNISLCLSMQKLVFRLLDALKSEEFKSPEILVQRAILKMSGNLHLTSKVESIVSGFGVGYRQMSRYFQKIKGKKPKQVFMELKLNEVCRLLLETTYSVTYIAQELGFSSSQHLSMQFKSIYGISPNEWRIQTQNQQQRALN